MKNIAVIGGGPFGIIASLKLSENKKNKITLFESSGKLGGLSASEKYKGQYMDYTTKFIPCNQFGRPGIKPSLEKLLNEKNVLLEDIGDYHFLKDTKESPMPPPLKNISKGTLLKEAIKVYKHFPQADQYSNMIDLEKIEGFKRDCTTEEFFGSLGVPVFNKLIEYFCMIFGNTIHDSDALSVLTSRNSYTTYNYLTNVFSKNLASKLIGKSIDKKNLLNWGNSLPSKFLMLTTGYDRFIQSLLDGVENVTIRLNHKIVDMDKVASTVDSSQNKYILSNRDNDTFSDFDEVVFAIPMAQLKKFKYPYLKQFVDPIKAEKHNYVLTSFCNVESKQLKYLEKGIYLDYNNPHNIGAPDANKDGSSYGLFKQFNADTMFQSLSMVNNIDRNDIDEHFIHNKWLKSMKEFGFNVESNQIKPYGWKVIEWNIPFAQVGDFKHFEKMQKAQGKEGIWFGGEIMCGPGIPIILKFIENLFSLSSSSVK